MTSDQMMPKHIAIIMDGNGRWAKKRHRPRSLGHQAGLKAVRRTIQCCAKLKIQCLTLFAFSSENWNRPETEVNKLMELFLKALQKEVDALHENGIRVDFIGDLTPFSQDLQKLIYEAIELTKNNTGLLVNIAINYGGRWDITQAVHELACQVQEGILNPQHITEHTINKELTLFDCPEPDLFIRTGGELRISNFLLWQIAYTELYFTDELWPDFDENELEKAIQTYKIRDRRYGSIKELN
ncbi:MAG: isoprenyl transferase [bacterium]